MTLLDQFTVSLFSQRLLIMDSIAIRLIGEILFSLSAAPGDCALTGFVGARQPEGESIGIQRCRAVFEELISRSISARIGSSFIAAACIALGPGKSSR